MKYILVRDVAPTIFQDKINGYLERGYTLYGSPYAYRASGIPYHCQAMVKSEKAEQLDYKVESA